MITHKSDQVKEFYNRQPFPGPYTARSVKEYTGHNRYISFISDAITHSRRVLDAGCGTGFITNYLAKIYPTKNFTGVDFADSMDHAVKIKDELHLPNLKFIKQDLTSFETEKSFDTIICQGVLHHIPDYQQTLSRLKGMLESKGRFIIGLYHPWGKTLQKWLPNNYHSETLEIDQEEHPFELSFSANVVKKMFEGYKLIASCPGVLFNYSNGGLTTYLFKKEERNVTVD
jgi:2-polyprenyl-3-methyl-5-hydroxy-6-metoxy-1,4-benzoquinol methylase